MKTVQELLGLRVMLVEDEDLIALLVEEILTELGCNVVATASSLEHALAEALTADIDVAIIDINLGGDLSYPVAEALTQRTIPFIFSTGQGELEIPANLAPAATLCKPFKQHELIQALLSFKRR